VKYALIKCHAQVWPVVVQCDCLDVSTSGYQQHVARQSADGRPCKLGKRMSPRQSSSQHGMIDLLPGKPQRDNRGRCCYDATGRPSNFHPIPLPCVSC
jgi:hypothetical protein